MGFGFVDEEEETRFAVPKIEHKSTDKLSYFSWDNLSIDMRVQSVITGTKGTIVKLFPKWKEIDIFWDNGKSSYYKHSDLDNVIVI